MTNCSETPFNLFRFTHFHKNASVTPLVSHTFKTKDLKPFRFTHLQRNGGGPFRIHQSPVTNHESLPVSPLDSALTSKRAAKFFTSNTYEKHTQGEGSPWGRNTNHESPVTNHESRTYPQSSTAPLGPEHPTGVKCISPRFRVTTAMATAVLVSKKPNGNRTGLFHWMHRATKEAHRVRTDFSADPVHDLRVDLRRCRSMASVLAEVVPIPYWRAIKKASRKLFRRLGELRDTQVMIEWVRTLAPDSDPPGNQLAGQLLAILAEQEERRKAAASAALARFDLRKWEACAAFLRKHASPVRPDGRAAQAVALERLQ